MKIPFFGQNMSCWDTFLPQNQWWPFLSFFETTSIGPCNLSNLVPLPYPHGAPLPPIHTVTSIHVFSIQQAQKRCLMSKSSRKFEILKLEGGKLILLILRLYMSTLMGFCSLWAAPTRLLRLFPCCTNTIPCPNFRHRCSDQIWVFLYTSMADMSLVTN